jgi:hypothetical protein
MSNPFIADGRPLSKVDVRNALSDIRSDIQTALEQTEKAENSGSIDAEIQLTLTLSGLEIKMTNFARMLHERLG